MSFINEGETGFRFVMRSTFDATGIVSATIKLKQPDLTKLSLNASAEGADPSLGDFGFLVSDEFDDPGLFLAQLILDMGGVKTLKGEIETFNVSPSL